MDEDASVGGSSIGSFWNNLRKDQDDDDESLIMGGSSALGKNNNGDESDYDTDTEQDVWQKRNAVSPVETPIRQRYRPGGLLGRDEELDDEPDLLPAMPPKPDPVQVPEQNQDDDDDDDGSDAVSLFAGSDGEPHSGDEDDDDTKFGLGAFLDHGAKTAMEEDIAKFRNPDPEDKSMAGMSIISASMTPAEQQRLLQKRMDRTFGQSVAGSLNPEEAITQELRPWRRQNQLRRGSLLGSMPTSTTNMLGGLVNDDDDDDEEDEQEEDPLYVIPADLEKMLGRAIPHGNFDEMWKDGAGTVCSADSAEEEEEDDAIDNTIIAQKVHAKLDAEDRTSLFPDADGELVSVAEQKLRADVASLTIQQPVNTTESAPRASARTSTRKKKSSPKASAGTMPRLSEHSESKEQSESREHSESRRKLGDKKSSRSKVTEDDIIEGVKSRRKSHRNRDEDEEKESSRRKSHRSRDEDEVKESSRRSHRSRDEDEVKESSRRSHRSRDEDEEKESSRRSHRSRAEDEEKELSKRSHRSRDVEQDEEKESSRRPSRREHGERKPKTEELLNDTRKQDKSSRRVKSSRPRHDEGSKLDDSKKEEKPRRQKSSRPSRDADRELEASRREEKPSRQKSTRHSSKKLDNGEDLNGDIKPSSASGHRERRKPSTRRDDDPGESKRKSRRHISSISLRADADEEEESREDSRNTIKGVDPRGASGHRDGKNKLRSKSSNNDRDDDEFGKGGALKSEVKPRRQPKLPVKRSNSDKSDTLRQPKSPVNRSNSLDDTTHKHENTALSRLESRSRASGTTSMLDQKPKASRQGTLSTGTGATAETNGSSSFGFDDDDRFSNTEVPGYEVAQKLKKKSLFSSFSLKKNNHAKLEEDEDTNAGLLKADRPGPPRRHLSPNPGTTRRRLPTEPKGVHGTSRRKVPSDKQLASRMASTRGLLSAEPELSDGWGTITPDEGGLDEPKQEPKRRSTSVPRNTGEKSRSQRSTSVPRNAGEIPKERRSTSVPRNAGEISKEQQRSKSTVPKRSDRPSTRDAFAEDGEKKKKPPSRTKSSTDARDNSPRPRSSKRTLRPSVPMPALSTANGNKDDGILERTNDASKKSYGNDVLENVVVQRKEEPARRKKSRRPPSN